MDITDYKAELNKKNEEIKELRELRKKLEEEKKILIQRYKVMEELKKYSCEYNSNSKNYYIYYNHFLENLATGFDTYKQRSEIYFESYEKVDEAIENVGEGCILKYYLGVKD